MARLHFDPQFEYHPRCKRVRVTHVMFADDLLVLLKANKKSIQAIMSQFQNFSACLGLTANVDTSEFYCAGVSDELQEMLCQEFPTF